MMKVKLGLNRLLGVMALVAIGITPAHATIATFNFEGQSLGAFSSVTDTQSNLTVTVTATSSGVVDVANSSTAVFGTRSLTTFFSNTLENLIGIASTD